MKTRALLTSFAGTMVCATLTLVPATAQASFVLLDNMNYGTADTGNTVGDWVDGSNRLNYKAGANLTFSGDADYTNDTNNLVNNGSLERNDSLDSRYYRRDFSDGTLTGEFWISLLIRFSGGSVDEFAGVSLNQTNSFELQGDLLGVGLPSAGVYQPIWFDRGGSATTGVATYDTDNSLAANSTHLLIAKLTIGPGADGFSMWVFDSADTFGQTEASLGAAHLSSNAANFGEALDFIQLGGNSGPTTNFDQLRLSDLSGDNGLKEVLTASPIPEPASLALLGLGGMLAGRRRRGGL